MHSGTWGFQELESPVHLTLLQSIYHAAKLYTLEIGPADGSGGPNVGPNWQIVVAFVLAVLLVVRALLALAGRFVRRAVTRRLLSGPRDRLWRGGARLAPRARALA